MPKNPANSRLTGHICYYSIVELPNEHHWTVLVLNGAADKFVTPESIEAFKQEMTSAGVDYRFVNYPGVRHGFTNPDADRLGKANNLEVAYDAETDKQSWEAMQQLFKDVFGD